jgi:uncharacterized RDD family membrane protein YckC
LSGDVAGSTGGELASLGARASAQFPDALLVLALIVGGVAFMDLSQGIALTAFALGIAYYLLADGLPGGQSLAKRALGIAVIGSDAGKPCGLFQSFLRNVAQVLGILDWLWIFGPARRRLGDRLAGTPVIRF